MGVEKVSRRVQRADSGSGRKTMARLCAPSRFVSRRRTESWALLSCLCFVLASSAAEAGLYTASDQIVLLSQRNARSVLVNSSAATVVEFYASWCGHCVAFSPYYKKLARDIKGRCEEPRWIHLDVQNGYKWTRYLAFT